MEAFTRGCLRALAVVAATAVAISGILYSALGGTRVTEACATCHGVNAAGAEFLAVGAHAVAVHATPRSTSINQQVEAETTGGRRSIEANHPSSGGTSPLRGTFGKFFQVK